MSTLLDLQHAMYRALIVCDEREASAYILADGIEPRDRLAIYRNTFVSTLIKALRLVYPAVDRLVGAEFFEEAAAAFIADAPPRTAWLDAYGAAFPDFLARFPPATSVPYLPDVAQLEWAVNKALHAEDVAPIDVNALSTLPEGAHERVRFAPHPSLSLLRTAYPADTIWRAVLAGDDAALAGIDLAAGQTSLLVERGALGVDVHRMSEAAWRLTAALCAGRSLQFVLDAARGVDASLLLAEHLAHGRFVGFELANASAPDKSLEALS